MERVVIVDYGMSNLHSVYSALTLIADDAIELKVTQDIHDIASADKVVFPGQGAAADCMRALNEHGLVETIVQASKEKPFLGICMGMQVLLESSEENDGTQCLGVYQGSVKNFNKAFTKCSITGLKVPHMGWNTIKTKFDHPLWQGIDQESYFYFVHSYFASPRQEEQIAGSTNYGFEFASVIASGKVFAMQCHPEKSGENGLQVLRNFLHWNGQ